MFIEKCYKMFIVLYGYCGIMIECDAVHLFLCASSDMWADGDRKGEEEEESLTR